MPRPGRVAGSCRALIVTTPRSVIGARMLDHGDMDDVELTTGIMVYYPKPINVDHVC